MNKPLQFILMHHRPRRFWNNFSRIRLALELESYFQEKASANQSRGGKYKGSANCPKAACIEARQEIAQLAGVAPRNVSNVKAILEKVHPRLIDALQDGTLSIHRAVQLCNVPRTGQVDLLLPYAVERATNKVARQTIARLRMKERVTGGLSSKPLFQTCLPATRSVRRMELPISIFLRYK